MAEEPDYTAEEEKHKRNWLKEHLPFEVRQMRHSLARLQETPTIWWLDWNAHLSAFAVSARCVRNFLANDDSNKSRGNFGARHFLAGGFSAHKVDELKKPFEYLDAYIFHVSKKRPTDENPDAKFDINDAKSIAAWIERELKRFLDEYSKQQ